MIKRPRLKPKEKLNICKQCNKWKPRTRQCEVCGCFMDLKALLKKRCPHPDGDKWKIKYKQKIGNNE